MYNYPHYKEQTRKRVIEFMRNHPFITLIGSDKKEGLKPHKSRIC